MTDLERKLAELVEEAMATNDALGEGMAALLVGRKVVGASGEVYDSDGGIAFELELDDGSVFECVVSGRVRGPAAELFRMGGGKPEGEE